MELLGVCTVLCIIWIFLARSTGGDSTGNIVKSSSSKEEDDLRAAEYRESEEEFLARQRFDEFGHRQHAEHADSEWG